MSSDVRLKATQVTGRPITWAQINLAASEDLRGLMRRNRWAAELVLAFIERMEPGGGGVVVASRETMREILGCSMPTVDRALRTIVDEGWAQRIRIGGTPALAINSRVAWVGPRGDLPQAVFSATVIASRAEQDAIALNPPPVRVVPFVRRGEEPLPMGQGLDPPSEPELAGVPLVVATEADPKTGEISDPWAHLRGLPLEQIQQAELEARGQLRIEERM